MVVVVEVLLLLLLSSFLFLFLFLLPQRLKPVFAQHLLTSIPVHLMV